MFLVYLFVCFVSSLQIWPEVDSFLCVFVLMLSSGWRSGHLSINLRLEKCHSVSADQQIGLLWINLVHSVTLPFCCQSSKRNVKRNTASLLWVVREFKQGDRTFRKESTFVFSLFLCCSKPLSTMNLKTGGTYHLRCRKCQERWSQRLKKAFFCICTDLNDLHLGAEADIPRSTSTQPPTFWLFLKMEKSEGRKSG